ncbi:MAG: PDZ domain-containing protein [Clostridiaceae bacterium]|jgi:serine protease Do|nr:PDZ domain-containing protein [Clostridiaceae bacterium]
MQNQHNDLYENSPNNGGANRHNQGDNKKNPSHLAIGVIVVGVVAAILLSAVTGLAVLLYANRGQVVSPDHTVNPTQTQTAPPVESGDKPPVETQTTETGSSGIDPDFNQGDLEPPASQDGKKVLTIPQIVERSKPAVVAIYTNVVVSNQFGGLSQNTVAGSGFIISADGYIVTNDHVVENARSIYVNLEDGRTFEAVTVGTDPYADVAVLKVEEQGLPYVVMGDSSLLRIGELAIAIGNPTGRLSGTVTSGIISALERDLTQTPIALIQTDAALNSGNSGGALLNAYGEVIGINQLKVINSGDGSMEQIQGISFAIPINAAKPIIESIIRTGKHVWPMIGISVSTVEEDLAHEQGLHYPGVVVVSVERGGAGSKAGLKVGDVITRFDGQTVETIKQLTDLKNKRNAGDQVILMIIRDSQQKEITMVLGGSS